MRLTTKIIVLSLAAITLTSCSFRGFYRTNQEPELLKAPPTTPVNAPTPADNTTTLPVDAGVIPVGTSAEMKKQLMPAPKPLAPLPNALPNQDETATDSPGASALPDNR